MYEIEIDTRAGITELVRRLEDPDRHRVEISETETVIEIETEKDAALRQLIKEMIEIDVTHRQHRALTELRQGRKRSASLDRRVEVGRARLDLRRRRPEVAVVAREVRVVGRVARVVEVEVRVVLRKTGSWTKMVNIRGVGVMTRLGEKS